MKAALAMVTICIGTRRVIRGLNLITRVVGLALCAQMPVQASVTVQDIDDYIRAGYWEVSLAVGTGELESPLSDNKNLRVSALPSIKYYGERFYLENTSLGFSLYEAPRFAIDLEGRLNADGIFFPGSGSYVTKPLLVAGQLIAEDERPVFVLDPPKRRLSYLGGVSLHWLGPVNVGLAAVGDISGVHGGGEAELTGNRRFSLGGIEIGVELGATYKSRTLVDYYYGAEVKLPVVQETESVYRPGEAINAHLKLESVFPISEKIRLLAAGRLDRLDGEVWRSPYVVRSETRSFFIGIQYTL